MAFNFTDQNFERQRIQTLNRIERKNKRRPVLLNSKQRVIGIDVEFLHKQVAEKKKHDEEERKNKLDLENFTGNMLQNLRVKALHEQINEKHGKADCLRKSWEQANEYKKNRALEEKHQHNEYNLTNQSDFVIEENTQGLRAKKKRLQNEQFQMIKQQEMEIKEREALELEKNNISEALNSLMLENANEAYANRYNNKIEENNRVQQFNLDFYKQQQENKKLNEIRKQEEERTDLETHYSKKIVTEPSYNTNYKNIVRTEYKSWHPDQIKDLNEQLRRQQENNLLNIKAKEKAKQDLFLNKCRLQELQQEMIRKEHLAKLETNNSVKQFNYQKSKLDQNQKNLENIYHLKPGIDKKWWPFGKDDR